MSIYDIDFNLQSDNLDNPLRRKPKFAAWLHSLMKPLQWIHDLFYVEYINGAYGLYAYFILPNAYNVGDRVVYADRGVYECILGTAGNYPTDTIYWIKILDNFVGLNERMKYTSQIITFEYLLNRWFFNYGIATQIYVQNNPIIQNVFVMGQTGLYSSAMAVNSIYSTSYMNTAPSFPTFYNFTIYVPSSLWVHLGSTTSQREKAIRAYADKFVLAGLNYNVLPF